MAEGHHSPQQIPGRFPRAGLNPQAFLGLRFRADDGRRVCWILYRHIVRETAGISLPEYEGVEDAAEISRIMRGEQISRRWLPVAPRDERPLDLVLMRGQVGHGREARLAPMHVGCVTRPGWMLDAEEGTGVMHRCFRETLTSEAHPKVRHRFIGVYRSRLLLGMA